MSPEKLEALRKLAAHEDTPIEEARNAALQYVRHGGNTVARAITVKDVRDHATFEMIREAFGPEVDAQMEANKAKLASMKSEIEREKHISEALRNERDALKKQLDDLKAHGKAILAFMQGEEKPKGMGSFGPIDATGYRIWRP